MGLHVGESCAAYIGVRMVAHSPMHVGVCSTYMSVHRGRQRGTHMGTRRGIHNQCTAFAVCIEHA